MDRQQSPARLAQDVERRGRSAFLSAVRLLGAHLRLDDDGTSATCAWLKPVDPLSRISEHEIANSPAVPGRAASAVGRGSGGGGVVCSASDWESSDAAADTRQLAPPGGARSGSVGMTLDLV